MARKVDIVDFNPSDGLTPLQTKKLNWNFKHLFDALGGVDIDQAGSVKSLVIGTHDLAVDQKATVVKKGTKNNVIVEIGIPAAQVSITDAQVDDVLANNAPTGTQVLRLTQLSRLWAGIKQYVDNAIGAIGSFVLKAGDTMTGDLKIVKNDARLWIQPKEFDHDGGAPSSTLYQRVLEVFDKDSDTIGMIEEAHRDDGRIGLALSAVRKVSGSYKYNSIVPYIADDGTFSYSISSPAAFRTAIDAAASSHNHAASNITSGTLALARGGTASDNTARAINTVFAGPSSGSAGNATWRSLTAADIPNLNASKITAGTLGVDRIPSLDASKITAGTFNINRLPTVTIAKGGTGATSAANARTNLGVAYTSLYNNASGTNGTVTLSETAANFTHLLIVYKWYPAGGNSSTYEHNCCIVRSPNNKLIALPFIFYEDGGGTGIRNSVFKISGTSITYQKKHSGSSWFSSSGQGSSSQPTTGAIEIVSVMGYKY